MTQDTATIIPFPAHPIQQPTSAPAPSSRLTRLAKMQDPASRSAAAMSQAIPRALAMCVSTPNRLPDPAIVAKVVISFAKRKGIAMTSVPKIFREQLLTLCAAGNPTALMLRDWLEGNRKLLAKDGSADAVAAAESGEGV